MLHVVERLQRPPLSLFLFCGDAARRSVRILALVVTSSCHPPPHHLSLYREGRWGTTDDFTTSFFPVLHCPLGLGELQACPFPDAVFPPLPLSALSSSPFHCALQDGFGQTR